MGSSKAGGYAEIPKYNLSAHVGVCVHRPGTEVLRIMIGDKIARRQRVSANTRLDIDRPNLFGGIKKEGGVSGLVEILLGAADQVMPEHLARRLGLTSATCPGFRGIVSLFFTGRANSAEDVEAPEGYWVEREVGSEGYIVREFVQPPAPMEGETLGFYWGSNNPYFKQPAVRVRAIPIGLNPSIALIQLPDDSKGRQQYAANPAHMVFECLTNREWGKGGSLGQFNIASYERTAQTLYDEGFGLAMLWKRQSKIEDFINEIIDHIQAVHYEDPETGKMTLDLLRNDYDPENLPLIDPSNADMLSFDRKAWGEIVNEVTVTWTNPETEKEETVTAQDLAAIAAQGGVNSTSPNYHGVRSQALAQKLAQRDLAAQSYPIAICEMEVILGNWKLRPGSVVRLTWPERGLNDVLMRVGDVTRGSSMSKKVRVKMQEDIFGRSRSEYNEPEPSLWQDTTVDPGNVTELKVGTAPMFLAHLALDRGDPADMQYPSAVAVVLPVRPTADYIGYTLWSTRTKPNGSVVPTQIGGRDFPASAQLATALSQVASGTLSFKNFYGPAVTPGDFVIIGTTADSSQEIAMVESISGSTMTVSRGMMDTVPREWAADTRLFFVSTEDVFFDSTERAAGESVTYRLATRTTSDEMSYDDATPRSLTLTDRAHLPLRPANVKVNGQAFGDFNAAGLSSFNITWANRNATSESLQALRWTEGTVTPDTGQKTLVKILDYNLAEIWVSDELDGTSYTLPVARFGAFSTAWVQVVSVKDGEESLQGHAIRFINVGT